MVTFGIDLMIDGLLLVGLSVAAAAKTAEQIAAVLLFLVIGVVVGTLYFAALRRSPDLRLKFGLVLGMLFGIPMVVVSLPMGQYTLEPAVAGLSVLALFLVWGVGCLTVYRGLTVNADGSVTEDEGRWAKSISRRQFIIRLGAATATITVLSSGLGMLLAQSERRQQNQAIAKSMDESKMSARPPFPNAEDPVAPAPGTRPEYTEVEDHYKVFLRTEPTVIDIETWSLPITGLVANPLVLTLDDLQNNYQPRDQFITLFLYLRTYWDYADQHDMVDRRRPSGDIGRRAGAPRGYPPYHHLWRWIL